MKASDLLLMIEAAGGKLTPEPDGRLLCQRIPREFRAELTALKHEVIAVLRERVAAPISPAFQFRPARTKSSTERRKGLDCRFCEHPLHSRVSDSYCPTCQSDHCRVVFCICGRGKVALELFPGNHENTGEATPARFPYAVAIELRKSVAGVRIDPTLGDKNTKMAVT